MEGGYTLAKFLQDTVSFSENVVANMDVYLEFLTTNSAFLWVFIGAAGIFGLKMLKGLA